MEPGRTVSDFTLPDAEGVARTLSSFLEHGPAVLFFYPKAGTKGCTAEACHFRDLAAAFAEVGAQRIGISKDPANKLKAFAAEHDFDFPLLSDPDGSVAEQFGAKRAMGLPFKRRTVVISADSALIASYDDEFSMEIHADRALEALRTA